ncbi:MAG TPA: MarR family transcriptional regulator [Gemmatimonadaceae bacterium]|nr:MarR family transcriptional regulator [Gemmatimonadaceae bacterium]
MDITTTPISPSLTFCLALARAYATLSRTIDRRLGGLHGLSFADFMILLELRGASGTRMRRVELSEALGLTPSAVTRALIPLEKIGLVSRQPDPHDARVGYATLTKAGRRVLDEAVESAEVVSVDAIPKEAVPELGALVAALSRIAGK